MSSTAGLTLIQVFNSGKLQTFLLYNLLCMEPESCSCLQCSMNWRRQIGWSIQQASHLKYQRLLSFRCPYLRLHFRCQWRLCPDLDEDSIQLRILVLPGTAVLAFFLTSVQTTSSMQQSRSLSSSLAVVFSRFLPAVDDSAGFPGGHHINHFLHVLAPFYVSDERQPTPVPLQFKIPHHTTYIKVRRSAPPAPAHRLNLPSSGITMHCLRGLPSL